MTYSDPVAMYSESYDEGKWLRYPATKHHARKVDETYPGRPGVRHPVEAENFSLCHSIQIGSGVHPASYPMGNVGKVAGAWSWPLASV